MSALGALHEALVHLPWIGLASILFLSLHVSGLVARTVE